MDRRASVKGKLFVFLGVVVVVVYSHYDLKHFCFNKKIGKHTIAMHVKMKKKEMDSITIKSHMFDLNSVKITALINSALMRQFLQFLQLY